MPAALVPPTVTAQLTDRLIGELPRFFGGRRAAMRELFQNAHRAGAHNVTITLDGNLLTFEDDGTGCPDPQLLLSAGATGWDESQVVEPAGLGFYSLLDRDAFSSVEAQSMGWRVNLVPAQVLAAKPIHVDTGTVQRGMRLQFILASNTGVEDDLKQARAYYPYRVTLNGTDLPVTKWQPTWIVETAVGRVGVRHRYSYHKVPMRAIWEHRGIEGPALGEALERAAKGDAIAECVVSGYRLHWVVDPHSGAMPKLPDRNDMATSPALDAAAAVILHAVTAFFREWAKRESATWPDTLPEDLKQPHWLMGSDLGLAILRELGWREAAHTCWEGHDTWYVPDDGWQQQHGSRTRLSKTFIAVADHDAVEAVNWAVAAGAELPFAVYDPQGLKPRIIKLQRTKKNSNQWIRLCKEIRLGKLRLPFLLDRSEGSALLATDADSAISTLMGHPVALPGLPGAALGDLVTGFLAAHRSDELNDQWADYDDDCVDWDRLEKDLVEQVSTDFIGGERAKARQHLHELQSERKSLHEAEHQARSLALRPSVKALARAFNRVEQDLESDIRRAAKKARLPT